MSEAKQSTPSETAHLENEPGFVSEPGARPADSSSDPSPEAHTDAPETGQPVSAPDPTVEPAAVSAPQAPDPSPSADPSSESVAASKEADREVLAASARYTRRAFVVAGLASAAGYAGYHALNNAPGEEMQPAPLRSLFRLNAALSRETFREAPLAPTYPLAKAENLRVNGIYGLKMPLKPASWRLQAVGVQDAGRHPRYSKDVTAWQYEYETAPTGEDQGHDTKVDPKMLSSMKMAPDSMVDKCMEDENHTGRKARGFEESGESDSTLPPGTPGLLLTLEDVLRLPRHELVTQFKCIEGWSQIVHWAGVRMADFLEAYPPEQIDGREPKFVYMETPDGDYYTGYDLHALRHPQALLVTEIGGQPLTQFHGAPLRLHMPTKYGYKQIKRIGLIAYTNDKPDDYWTKLGYDWYAGL